MPKGTGLPSLTMMLFNRLIGGLLPQMGSDPLNVEKDDIHHEALEVCQRKKDKGTDTQKDPPIFITGATIIVWQENGGDGCMVYS